MRTSHARGMGWVLVQRLARLVASLFVLITASFFMIQAIPGNAVMASLGDTATPAMIKLRTRQLGLNKPLGAQYVEYLRGVVTGHLGTSLVSNEPVIAILKERIPQTLQLAIPAFFIVIIVAIPLGMAMAVKTAGGRRPRLRLVFTLFTGLGNSIPDFVWATLFSVIFIVLLHLFPVAGDTGFASHVLPVAALSIAGTATLSRIVRVETAKVLQSSYIIAAKGRRLPKRLLYVRHVLPNAATAALTYSGMVFSALIAGTVLVENVFAWPGIGTELAQAVIDKDYPLIQGALLVLGTMILLAQLLVDIALNALDPRSRIVEG